MFACINDGLSEYKLVGEAIANDVIKELFGYGRAKSPKVKYGGESRIDWLLNG